MAFHLEWHEAAGGRGQRYFEQASAEPALDRILTVVAALGAMRDVAPRAEFTANLRARLLSADPHGPNDLVSASTRDELPVE